MLSEVFYVSRSTHPRGHLSDVEIVETSLMRNAQLDLTGCLIRGTDWFAHSLEGPHDALQSVFESIQSDPRHDKINAWRSDTLAHRRFPEWRILFADAEDYRIEIELVFRTSNLSVDVKQSHMRKLLENHLNRFNLRWNAA